MASGFLMLLDDIATLLDDVALMCKMAAKKNVGIVSDDLAVNAKQVFGLSAEREIPVVWAVAKGSFLNKIILIPLALILSRWLNVLIQPLLILGGLYLCYEAAEKVIHSLFTSKEEQNKTKEELLAHWHDPAIDRIDYEKDKIKNAIRTDLILSAEIVILTLGQIATAPFLRQLMVLGAIGVLMTVGVYGAVMAIVKIDDLGFYLKKTSSAFLQRLGDGCLFFAPRLMKFLSVAGTTAMFLVGGGIFTHGVTAIHHFETAHIASWGTLATMGFEGVIGFVAGLCIVLLMVPAGKFLGRKNSAPH